MVAGRGEAVSVYIKERFGASRSEQPRPGSMETEVKVLLPQYYLRYVKIQHETRSDYYLADASTFELQEVQYAPSTIAASSPALSVQLKRIA